MIGKAGVPPDAGVNVFGKFLAVLVGAGFAGGAVDVDSIRARDHHLRGLAFSRMHVDGSFFGRTSRIWTAGVEKVDDVVVWLIELGLGEEWEQALVTSLAVDDNYFLAAVAGHFVGGFLYQRKMHIAAV